MRRRDFIELVACSAIAWPAAAHAQQSDQMRRIGVMTPFAQNDPEASVRLSPDAYPDRVIAFHQGLRQLGYIEGENVVVDYRWALGEYDRLPAFAAELVKRGVSVLVATGGELAARLRLPTVTFTEVGAALRSREFSMETALPPVPAPPDIAGGSAGKS
jgi:putative ABC transport system substrate-binding protein